jgi:hypothetical protein
MSNVEQRSHCVQIKVRVKVKLEAEVLHELNPFGHLLNLDCGI